jgi:putative toxin-antitoxin system antitoxin component (TIGR02293 family)
MTTAKLAPAKLRSQSDASRIAEFMGLPKWQDMDDLGLVDSIRRGLPVATAKKVAQRVDPGGRFFSPSDIIPRSTLHRREKTKSPFTKDESEKIIALSKVFSAVIAIYHGDLQRSAQFLMSRHAMLGDRTPLELAKESSVGADLVLKILALANAGVAA